MSIMFCDALIDKKVILFSCIDSIETVAAVIDESIGRKPL